ncbi:Alpha-N-acetylglucosaminidase [Trichinella patagoniensis]|uniref:GDP-4-keto-6-deoxy-D-mannose-3,5-epimerase-4-reductase n=1 Tax=Trichinella patagoniensis TaxID=990121 RepID=A0A0V1A7B3_9BILA|nr:Alpha-N-acetylglucosaminidase [Trichinella patagoniensis]
MVDTVLVTGASGLIGRAMQAVIAEAAKNYEVNMNWIFVSSKDADLTDYVQTKRMFRVNKPTAVIHLAAKVGGLFCNLDNNLSFFRENMMINDNVLRCAHEHNVKRVISCLSTCIFPDNTTYPLDENMIHLGPPHESNMGYAYAKRMLDMLSSLYNRQYGYCYTSIIPCNVFGPHDNFSLKNGHSIPALIHKCYLAKENNTPLVVFGTGKPLRQYIYSLDLARLIIWALENYKEPTPIIFATDEADEVTIEHVAKSIAQGMQFQGPILFDTSKSDGQFKKTSSNAKMRSYLPDFKFTPFDKAIQETAEWFTANFASARNTDLCKVFMMCCNFRIHVAQFLLYSLIVISTHLFFYGIRYDMESFLLGICTSQPENQIELVWFGLIGQLDCFESFYYYSTEIGDIPELFIIELQGDLELSNSKSLSGTLISAFSCNKQGNAFMIIGRHILRGKVEQLQRPIALVKQCSADVSTSTHQDCLQHGIRWSLIFWKIVIGLLTGITLNHVYSVVGCQVEFFQTLALLEIVHSYTGLVRSPTVTTAIQVLSRLFILWPITHCVVEAQSSLGTYTLFIGLYPLGVAGELLAVFAAMGPIGRRKLFTLEMPNIFNMSFNFYYSLVSHVIHVHAEATKEILGSVDHLKPSASALEQISAVQKLLNRISFGLADFYVLEIDRTLSDNSEMVLVKSWKDIRNQTLIKGTSGVALAFGVNAHLRNMYDVHIAWDGIRVELPAIVSPPHKQMMFKSIGRYRYFGNVCTFSYSFAWWNWSRWEYFIDWMALNGINLPLAHVGNEVVWKSWQGPLTETWHQDQLVLQKRILKRMVEFGMLPILPAFAGHVPDGFRRIFPTANLLSAKCWIFNSTYSCLKFVHPSDPLFLQIGKAYMQKLENYFGLFHAYSADPFNEMVPNTFDVMFLRNVSFAIYNVMVLQSWMFLSSERWLENENAKHFLTAVPTGSILVVDLYAEEYPLYEKFSGFYNQPFIWCMLHNFGGVQGLYGNLARINQKLADVSTVSNISMVGTGLSMEGIDQNYVVYQMALDRFWSPNNRKVDLAAWYPYIFGMIVQYCIQRYGRLETNVISACKLLLNNVYCAEHIFFHCKLNSVIDEDTRNWLKNRILSNDHHNIGILTLRPKFGMKEQGVGITKSIYTAWGAFLQSSRTCQESEIYINDLVELTKHALMLTGAKLYEQLQASYIRKYGQEFLENAAAVEQVLSDLEWISKTHSRSMLSKWIEIARANGKTVAQSDQLEENLRMQVTIWGPQGEIVDYARKQWAALFSEYYLPRWRLFFAHLYADILQLETFNQTLLNSRLFHEIELPFALQKIPNIDQPTGNTVVVSKILYNHMNNEEKSENADGTKQNNKREKLVTSNSKKFQCTKTGFERCAMQITIAIKVPYRQ